MKKILSTILGLSLLTVLITPSTAWAQTKITIENDTGAQELIEQRVTDFLKDNNLIENCLRNKRNQEKRPLVNAIAVCSIMNAFSNENFNIGQSWREATRLRLVERGASRSERLNDLQYLAMLFQTAGLTVSPISEQNYRKELREVGFSLPAEEMKTFITALEHGIISIPGTEAEAILLKTDLQRISKIEEALAYLYQVASSAHDTPSITISSPFQPAPSNTLQLESVLKEVVRIIESESYFKDSFDEEKAMGAAIKAIADSLEADKYIQYYTEEEYQSFSDGLNGNLEGIGAYIEEKDGQIIIISPIDGSPAAKAGLKPQDIITFIDDVSTEGMTLQEAVTRIKGEKGTTVKLNIVRDGKAQTISIVRAKIEIPALTTSNKNGVEIIKLVQFSASSAAELKVELDRIIKENPRGIVIDLRNNPGGFLDQVLIMVDYFVKENQEIVHLKNQRSHTRLSTTSPALVSNTPISILINKGSASASEILAGALQSYGIAKIYGETSFGKGTVQNIITLYDPSSNKNSAFKLTTAEYLIGGPNGEIISIDDIGVIPDSNPNGTDLVDDPETERDEALDAVLNLMR